MKKEDCVFCKIVDGKLPSAKLWEDKDYLAVLDNSPNTRGMSLVLTKNHYDSYIFNMRQREYEKFMGAARKVANVLEKGLEVNRVALVMEGMGVNHAHIKLYPLHGVAKDFQEFWARDKVFFEKYEGYLSTMLGPKKDISELEKLASEIRRKAQLK